MKVLKFNFVLYIRKADFLTRFTLKTIGTYKTKRKKLLEYKFHK